MKAKSNQPKVLNLKHTRKEKEKDRFKLLLIENIYVYFEYQRAKSSQYSGSFWWKVKNLEGHNY